MSVALKRVLSSSLLIWLAITIYGVYFLFNLQKYINFGIDLVGGTYITLEVQTDKLLENELRERTAEVARDVGEELVVSQHFDKQQNALVVEYADAMTAQNAEASPLNRQNNLNVVRDGVTLVYTLPEVVEKKLIHEAVEGNINVLRTRVDKFGVGEVTIAAQGDKNIVIELPNVQDVQKAKSIIGTSALLEIKPVIDGAQNEEELLKRYSNCLPEDTEIVYDRARRGQRAVYLVPRYTDLTGRLLKNAQPIMGGQLGIEPVVAFELKPEGGDKFYELTSRGPNQMIAMIVDGVVVTAATAKTPLRTNGEISGNFTVEQTTELAALLRSGAFVAPVSFEEDRTIGPSLGSESIRGGLISCLIGLALLFLFSVIMYKVAGLFAFVVLLYNLLLILFALAWLGATLTLPGIAGMVLTIGMAIDSSILIYERIREELAQGSTLRAAVKAGFTGATVTILDANITHFLVAVVLYKLGAGAIQGFAVTMIVGIIATLLTGLVLLRAIFDFMLDVVGVTRIRI